MTFIPQQQEKQCFIACSEDKVNAGLCDCINRMRKEALRQPLVMESVCSCSKGKGIDHDEDGKAYCIDCGNYLEQTVP